jgi:hypothetical protein
VLFGFFASSLTLMCRVGVAEVEVAVEVVEEVVVGVLVRLLQSLLLV